MRRREKQRRCNPLPVSVGGVECIWQLTKEDLINYWSVLMETDNWKANQIAQGAQGAVGNDYFIKSEIHV